MTESEKLKLRRGLKDVGKSENVENARRLKLRRGLKVIQTSSPCNFSFSFLKLRRGLKVISIV